jgi:hypothetical protein
MPSSHGKTTLFQREVGLLQQSLPVFRVLGLDQNFQQVVQIPFDAFSQHKTVVPRELSGVAARPENQVVSLGDHGQLLGFFH